jgi:hypothetical protein
MKKILMGLFGLLLMCQGLHAQRIIGAEYFFDSDPGQGKGTTLSFTVADSVNASYSIPVSSLSAGFHSLFVRVMDSVHHWSLYEGRTFYIQSPAAAPPTAQIKAAEYFFDTDPGQGKGTGISTATADSITQSAAIPVSSLSSGYHSVFVRTQNTAGVWSLYEGRNFFIQPPVIPPAAAQLNTAEYFFDTDPGQGKGNPIAFTSADSVNNTQIISVNALTAGFHNLFVRAKNTDGVWSLYEGRNFFVQAPVTASPVAQIKAAEYFVDADPGQGNGTPVAFASADSVTINKIITLTGINPGFHNLFVRTQNTAGVWSLYEGRNLYVAAPLTPPKPAAKIVAAEYFFDKDPGVGHGSAVAGLTAADSINMNISVALGALSNGAHKAFVRVKDSVGVWSLYEGRAFTIKSCAVTVSATGTNPTCMGGSNGTATAVPGSGTGAYTFSWSTTPPQTTATANNLSAGIYTITVTDSSGCPASTTVTLAQPVGITLTTNVVNTSCNLPNGQALANASGGVNPYTYSWSTSPVQTSSAATGLAAGSYTVTVHDANNCSANATVNISTSSAISLTVTTTPSQCGVALGKATVAITGGTAPFSYNWSSGSVLNHADSLRSGIYIITVTDVNHCSTFAAATISDSNGPVANVSITPVNCAGKATGALSVAVIGGTSPYTYSWSNGATTAAISGLTAGPYQVSVKDAGGCAAVQSVTVTEPPALALNVSSTTSACGVSTGTASAVVSGGTSPYTYSWSSGTSNATANNLGAGVYLVTITDGRSCRDSARVAVSNTSGPVIAVGTVTDANCSTGVGGSAGVTIAGGTAPYTYSWSNGATSASVSNLGAGNYTLKVTDAGSCIGTANIVVPSAPPLPITICEVTVDNATQKNMIVWDKSGAKGIKAYNIYKESTYSGVYFLAATVPNTQLSTYLDPISNPQSRSWRYKISQVDSCGIESPLSPSHKTMHLTVNQGLNNTVNLIWDNYEGLSFGTYILYRDTSYTTFTKLDSFPNNIFTYTDINPPVASRVYYRVGIDNPSGCNPTVRPNSSINYNSSKSNTGNHLEAGGNSILSLDNELNSLTIFPNPNAGVFNLSLLTMKDRKNLSLKIFNAMGQLLLSEQLNAVSGGFQKQINLSDQARGIYFVQIMSDRSLVTRRIVIE